MCPRSTHLLSLALLTAALAVWNVDPLLRANQSQPSSEGDLLWGSWQLNVEKSKYVPGPPPKSQIRTYEPHPEGVKATIRTTNADGTSTVSEFTAKYDMVEYPVTGNPEADMIALKKVDAYTADAVLTHAGREFGTARRTISQDGKMMTITFQGRDSRGRTIKNVAVYERK